MTNLLAILVSVAMLLTGVSTAAKPEAMVGRVMTVGNLSVTHNGENAALDLYAALGVATDGVEAVYDFYIGDKDQTYLPFQLVATGDGLLMQYDGDGQTLSLTAEDVSQLLGGLMTGYGAETQAMLDIYLNELMPAYVDMLSVMTDEGEMAALRKRSWEIYDQVVERGEGVPGKLEYEGKLYDANTYEYTLDGAQIGRLTDAIYATNDRLNRYLTAYFKLVALAPEEAGLKGATNFETLLQKIDMRMRMSESIADNGLVMMDGKLTIVPPVTEADSPVESVSFNIHQTRFGEDEFSTVTFDIPAGDLLLNNYIEYSRSGRDARTTVNITGNPENAAVGEDGEGDGADALYITLDYDVTHRAEGGTVERTASATLDMADTGHMDFSLSAEHDGDGVGVSHVACNASMGEETWAVAFDVVVTGEAVQKRVAAEGAVGLKDYNFPALLTSLGEDFSRLMAADDVQTLAGLFTPAAAADPAPTEEASAESALPFANPQFDWLPEGYSVVDVSVDSQYDDVTCLLFNKETGGTIVVDMTPSSHAAGGLNYYVIKDDGFKAVDGLLLSEEDCDNYFLYTADDGVVSYVIYPDSKNVSATDILNILIGLHF